MAKKFKGSLTLEWKNKNKSIILQDDGDNTRSTDIPLDTKLHWVNEDESLYYELDSEKGKGKKAYWVDRNDIRVKEVRPLIHKKTYIAKAIKSNKKSDLINDTSNEQEEYTVVESNTTPDDVRNGRDRFPQGMLIKGDNLLALNALVKHFENKPEEERPKCICIDPPYNTGSAFEHYDDNIEHSEWLTLMRDRLTLLRKILREDGSIWITVDDDESHYMKILCDEVFGRLNFISNIVWQKIHSIKNDAKYISINHDHILLYSKNKELIKLNLLERTEEMNARYSNPDNDPRGSWQSGDLVANEERTGGYYVVKGPTGKNFNVPKGKHWVYSEANMKNLIEDNRIWFGKDGSSFPRKKRFLNEVQDGRKADTWWESEEVGHNQEAKRETKNIAENNENVFTTPKPERLLQRIIHIATNPGDTVLDCFGGSGTTYAVAHKMGRNWVGVEIGNHADTHIIPRMVKVLNGEDQSGISKAVGWKGGGSFSYYHLGQSIISINKKGEPDFNWKLGRAELEKSLLLTYDFAVEDVSKNERKDARTQRPNLLYTIGYKTKNGKRIAGVCSLSQEPALTNEKGEITEPGEFMSYMEFSALLKKIGEADFIFLYTNRGIEISANEIPENMEIIKVPSSVFQELEE